MQALVTRAACKSKTYLFVVLVVWWLLSEAADARTVVGFIYFVLTADNFPFTIFGYGVESGGARTACCDRPIFEIFLF